MFHRFSTWWRALGVVLLGLATVTWPSAPFASSTPVFSLLAQAPTTTLHSSVGLVPVSVGAPSGATVNVAIYPAITTLGQIAPLVSGVGITGAPLASTTIASPACHSSGSATVLLEAVGAAVAPSCTHPVLRLLCAATSCDGVYPLRYTLGAQEIWSMVAVHVVRIPQRVRVVLLAHVDTAATSSLDALKVFSHVPLTVGVGYDTLTAISTHSSLPRWRRLFATLLSAPAHRTITTPPAGVDYGNLLANGFGGEVLRQLSLEATLTHRHDTPHTVWLLATPTTDDLNALAKAGVASVVVPDTALSPDPTSTLQWGAPEHVAGVNGTTVLGTDDTISTIANATTIPAVLRAILVANTIAFLHFDAPNDPAPRTVPIVLTSSTTGAFFDHELLADLSTNPFAVITPLGASLTPALVGSNGIASTWPLAGASVPAWSHDNATALSSLVTDEHAFTMGLANTDVNASFASAIASAEVRGTPAQHDHDFGAAHGLLAHQFGLFHVDNSTVTLTSQGTALPITIVSHAHYAMTVLVHLVANSLDFTKGPVFPVTLSQPTTSVRVALRHAWGSNVTLQVYLLTPDGSVVLSHTAVLVHVGGTSVVGYFLSAGSLLVLGMWWLRTHRRSAKGKHTK